MEVQRQPEIKEAPPALNDTVDTAFGHLQTQLYQAFFEDLPEMVGS